jgi:hypothetical protein
MWLNCHKHELDHNPGLPIRRARALRRSNSLVAPSSCSGNIPDKGAVEHPAPRILGAVHLGQVTREVLLERAAAR